METPVELRPSLIWLFPLIFVIHDGEEAFTMAAWLNNHRELLRNIADAAPLSRRIVANMPSTNGAVAGAIAFELLIVLAATIGFARFLRFASRSRSAVYIYAALLAAYLVHVVAHIGQSIILGMYTPGVVSAVLVVPPVGGYLYWQLLRCRLLDAKSAAISAAAGVLSILPIVTTAHLIGRWLFN